jgi:hypothetical protein
VYLFQNFCGTVDLGGGPSELEEDLATHALVYMVNCVNMNWKIPIGHFFVAGLSGSELANLTKMAIENLNSTGITVLNVVCDNPSNNWSMLNHLGANLYSSDPEVALDIRNNLQIPVFAVLDACHLIKLVRNCFGDYKVLYNGKGEKISWEYIEELHNLQTLEGLHLANKLRDAHIDFKSDRMKTSLAVQTLSKSVAKSLEYCSTKYDQFIGCEATCEFLMIFNNLFDLLNSKSKFGKFYSAPLTSSNFDTWSTSFAAAKDYILSLKDAKGCPLIKGPRKNAFLGLLADMNSFNYMYQTYVLTNHLQYLLTFKFSQDHIGKLLNFLSVIANFVLLPS